ncbi:MAG TPA: alpha/beta hydrolase [Stellaceae bacterium]|nr:alpha/beta hydrolase [Stellaceae bacterium]
MGERSHLLSPAVNLTTHIMDVVNLALWEDLDGFVLCGHSYGGAVVTGVAECIEKRISSIVYLDAFIPGNGQAMADIAPRKPAPGDATPAPPAAGFRVNARDQAWVESKTTPQPNGTLTEKLAVTGVYQRIPKKTYVRATVYDAPHFRAYYEQCKAMPGWETYEIATGHDAMLDDPQATADLLERSI